jgi:hypothetical protein
MPVEITPIHEKVLDGADSDDSLGVLLMPVSVKPTDRAAFEVHAASTVEATSTALAELLREGLVELRRLRDRDVGPERVPQREAEAVAVDPASWAPPRCWSYGLALTVAGDAAWSAICDARTPRSEPELPL